MASRKFFPLQNGHSSSLQNGHSTENGHQNGNGYSEPRIAIPEMCFFCFDVLHKELHCLDRHVEPNHLGISNSALWVVSGEVCGGFWLFSRLQPAFRHLEDWQRSTLARLHWHLLGAQFALGLEGIRSHQCPQGLTLRSDLSRWAATTDGVCLHFAGLWGSAWLFRLDFGSSRNPHRVS